VYPVIVKEPSGQAEAAPGLVSGPRFEVEGSREERSGSMI
jgi:hypothetical protein